MDCPRCKHAVPSGARLCKRCGANIPAGQSLLAEAGFAADGQISGGGSGGAAAAGAPARIMRGGHRLATIGDRLLAATLDFILLFAIFIVASFWTAQSWGGLTQAGLVLGVKPFLLALAMMIPLAFLYFWVLECLPGATVGKLIMGLAVRQQDGTRLDLRRSAIRNGWRAVDGLGFYLIGFLVAIFSRMRQRIGDHMARTVVLEAPASEWRQGAMVLVWLLALLGAALGSGKIYNTTSIDPLATGPSRAMLRMHWSGRGISFQALHVEVSLNWSPAEQPAPQQQAYGTEQPK
ncbi:MAG: RDD family protein [Acidobacteriales bacterium]|nr:RDD family protein [Terriglobales bacterium]